MDDLDRYRLPFPPVVRIEPASKCNLACSHCPTGTVDMFRSIMKPDMIDRVIGQLEKHRGQIRVGVLYHGGEPLLNKHFIDMLQRVKKAGVTYVKTITNGMLLTDAHIEGMVREGLDLVEFSTDGDSAGVSDTVRRNSDYLTIIRNVKRLLDYKRKTGAEKPEIRINNCRFVDPATYRGGEPEPSPHLIDEFQDYLGEVKFQPYWARRWPHLPAQDELFDSYADSYDTKGDQDTCDSVVSTVTIRWNGDVVACCDDLTSQLCMGNVIEQELEEIWNGERYLRLRQQIAMRSYNASCGNCGTVRRRVLLALKPEFAAGAR